MIVFVPYRGIRFLIGELDEVGLAGLQVFVPYRGIRFLISKV